MPQIFVSRAWEATKLPFYCGVARSSALKLGRAMALCWLFDLDQLLEMPAGPCMLPLLNAPPKYITAVSSDAPATRARSR
jgi:hypothetical protein